MKVMNNNIAIQPVRLERVRKSGIILADSVDLDSTTFGAHVGFGKVTDIPDDFDPPSGYKSLKVGSIVIYDKTLGQELTINKEPVFIASAYDLLAEVELPENVQISSETAFHVA